MQEGLHGASGTHYELANWRKKADRLAMCSYLLTRELLGADVGSVVMFAIPQDGSLVRPPVEHFLYTMPREVRVLGCRVLVVQRADESSGAGPQARTTRKRMRS